MNKHVHFEPYVVLYSNPRNPQSKNCRDGGKYCAPDPDNDGIYTGRDVISEMLREKCLYKTDSSQWVPYMKAYQKNCMKKIDYNCSFKIMTKDLKMKINKVQQCETESNVIISGTANTNVDNTI